MAQDQRPDYDKGLDNFEPRMIELQKKYARDLLTHVNPYTKTAYADEPAVAMVEINNENALFAVWGWDQLDRLPEPYATTFRKLWNAWLRKKYGDTERLRQGVERRRSGRWATRCSRNGDFAQPLGQTWNVERDDQTEVQTGRSRPTAPRDAAACGWWSCARAANSWHPQLSQAGFAVKKGDALHADLRRAGGPEPQHRRQLHDGPRAVAAARASTDASTSGPEWKPHRFTFVADGRRRQRPDHASPV